ncbi:MAG: hypothetical protein U1G07_21790 [Verrucomicrobiota bacterium]
MAPFTAARFLDIKRTRGKKPPTASARHSKRLAIHRDYPADEDHLLAAAPSAFKTPIDMPTIQGKYTRNLDWEGKIVASCVHCHQIGDALRTAYREGAKSPFRRLYCSFPRRKRSEWSSPSIMWRELKRSRQVRRRKKRACK